MIVFTPDRKPNNYKLSINDTFAVLMPMMISDSSKNETVDKSEMEFGASDIDMIHGLKAYFDFDKNCIVSDGKDYQIIKNLKIENQANITAAQLSAISGSS